jgi:hypothetical protein
MLINEWTQLILLFRVLFEAQRNLLDVPAPTIVGKPFARAHDASSVGVDRLVVEESLSRRRWCTKHYRWTESLQLSLVTRHMYLNRDLPSRVSLESTHGLRESNRFVNESKRVITAR